MPFGHRKKTSGQKEPNRRFEFVGRNRELDAFFDNLYLTADDPKKKPIISISGVGGVGKTRLLQQIIQNTPADFVVSYLDETDDISDEIGKLLGVICRNARKSGRAAAFDKTQNLILRRNEILGKLQSAQNELPKGFFELTYRAARLAVVSTPVGPLVDLIASESTIAEVLETWGNRFLRKQTLKEDRGLLFEPKELLTQTFISDVNRLGQGNKSVLLIFDTFETISPSVNPWLLKYLIGDYREDINCNLHIITAGRNPLDKTAPGWHQWILDDLIMELDIQPFTDQELRDYVNINHASERIDIKELAKVTSRLPLWLELWSLSGQSLEEYWSTIDLQNIADRILKSLSSDEHRVWVAVAAMCKWFDGDVLGCLLEKDGEKAFNWLATQEGFVRASRNNKLKVHDVIQEILQKHLKLSTISRWDEQNLRIGNYILARGRRSLQSSQSIFLQYCDDEWKSTIEDYFTYILRMAKIPNDTLVDLAGFLLEALNYDLPLFYKLSELVQLDNRGILPDLRGSWLGKDLDDFRSGLEQILAWGSLQKHQTAIAYNWIGYVLRLQGKFNDAIAFYKKALTDDAFSPAVYYDMADVYTQIGELEKAKHFQLIGRENLENSLVDDYGRQSIINSNLFEARARVDLGYLLWYASSGPGGTGKTKFMKDVLSIYDNANKLFSKDRDSDMERLGNVDKEISKLLSNLEKPNSKNLKIVKNQVKNIQRKQPSQKPKFGKKTKGKK